MTNHKVKPTSKKSRILALFLYSLPIVFFIVSYFLITTSGEDIWQGANNFRTSTPLNPLADAINAFKFNSRITDMYAWTVIDFFDYQFTFGPDLIFRLIDVITISATFYLLTYLALGRKPQLTIKDALIFCALFATVTITPFGRTFYIEFSMIHNYVPLALVTLLFSIPYLNLVIGKPPKKRLDLLAIGMLLLGVYFGMAATITPLAFLITVALYCFIKRKSLKKPPLWFFTGLAGTIIGFAICWLVGSGVDHYTDPTTAATFNYIAFGDIFTSPTTTIPGVLYHEIYNFGITLIPLFACFAIGLIFTKNRRQFFTRTFYTTLSPNLKSLLFTFAIFLVIHILGASLVKAPPRLLIPAYLAGIIIVFRLFLPYLNSKLLATCVVAFTAFMLLSHTVFLIKYRTTTSQILQEIQTSDAQDICIDLVRLKPPRFPIIDLGQANILVDWGTPEVIYGKNVTFCPTE